MKKMSRKNFRGGPLFSSSKSSSAAHGGASPPGPNGAGGAGSMRRATWADKIRDKLPPLGELEYEVLWERGVLGVIFLESEKDGIPYVSKATESCISPAVSQGDILKYVNVVRSKDHSFSDFFKILATMKKPVLLRFERLAASTPSSDEDEAAQLFGVQRSSSTNAVHSAGQYARQNGPGPDDADPAAGKFQRANSVPQKDQKPPKAARGAFWRATAAKDSVGPANPAQSVGPANGAANDRMAASQAHRRVPSSRDHQVSPRDAVAANGSGGHAPHSPLGPHEYQVYWETGSLGLFFGENRATSLPVVTRSTPSANPVVRRAVAINDTLVSANGIKSADYTFEAFFGRLQQMNKPVRLVFRRRQPNDQVVIVKQGDQQQQQQQQQQQLQQQLQQRQQQMREQQETREQEQKRELLKIRDQQQRDQQLREQQQREMQLREQKQREMQLREQQQREMQLREQQQREIQLREQQQREKKLREQQEREQQQQPWDLPEHIPSPTIKAEPIEVDEDEDEDDDVDVGVPVSPSADTHLDHVPVAELAEEAELVEEAELAEEGELVEDAELAELAEEAELAQEAELADEAEPVEPSHLVDNSAEDEVEVGVLADVEVGIAVEETESEVAESSASESDQDPWDLEPESDRQSVHHGSSGASSGDEASSSSNESSSIEIAVEASKVDFSDASESPDEFANDPDISSDIDNVDSDIMMQETPKDKVDSSNPPKPSKSSLNANLAKYKKKGKTTRGVIKLPALMEDGALTVPLVAPNAVNTTVQVRGRPKPKLTMADTPDSTTYLIKWKENRSIGLQLKEVRLAKGTYPLVTDVCHEPCCELLRHICVGDVIIEINGRNTSTMGVKKTVNFLKTCTKTTLMKIRHGPGFVIQRVSAAV
ncbi:hypothetical protein PHYPSEUDO_001046 [Phytophthora pseudosyringae]|uniref:PDZ domain-containing protein n=1 Tax=Phytophthora pseudosyringae TaxID=221518 RepID=A0A8T1VX80_9STRA|nr:hypothetical protein PHYPSEUDO_001046 [Phytophthora pseudosyringae]